MAFSVTDIEVLRKAKQEGLTKEQALARLSESRTSSTSPAATRQPAQRSFLDKAKDFAGGALNAVLEPGRTIQNAIPGKLLGTSSKDSFEQFTGTDVDTGAGKAGQFAGDVALFAAPGAMAARATAGASMATRALAQGGAAAATQAVKTGDIGADEAAAFVFGAASVPAGDAIQAASKNLSTKLPEWLVKPLLKQAKDAKVQGKDIAPYLVNSGRIGSVDSLIAQTDTAISQLDEQVNSLLSKGAKEGVTVTRSNIVDSVAQTINDGGGAIDAEEIIATVERLAPQARGLLQKETLTLVEANKLRQLIDRTLGDRGFLMQQLPFNKEVLRSFTNTLRETVKSSGDDSLRGLYDDYAKNITLRNALLDRANSGGGANSVGLYDLMTGGGAFAFTGDPITAIGAAVGRRAFESGATKTALAQVFKNTDKVVSALSSVAPAERAVILQFITSLTGEEPNE